MQNHPPLPSPDFAALSGSVSLACRHNAPSITKPQSNCARDPGVKRTSESGKDAGCNYVVTISTSPIIAPNVMGIAAHGQETTPQDAQENKQTSKTDARGSRDVTICGRSDALVTGSGGTVGRQGRRGALGDTGGSSQTPPSPRRQGRAPTPNPPIIPADTGAAIHTTEPDAATQLVEASARERLARLGVARAAMARAGGGVGR